METDREIIVKQGLQIEELKNTLYKIQLTGEIPPLNHRTMKSKSFKKFLNRNDDMKKYADKKLLKKMRCLEDRNKKLEKIITANCLDYKSISLHKTNRNYIRIAVYLNVEELLDAITSCKDEYYTLPNGYKVRSRSLRYQTFANSIRCVECGLKGCFLALEKGLSDNGGNEQEQEGRGYHLNLYALNELGQEVLMTKDHIYPRSKGGIDHISNLQTMCVNCNSRKADKVYE